MLTEEEEFAFLFLLFDSGTFFMLDTVFRWILLRRIRQRKFLTSILSGPTTLIRFWPQQRQISHHDTSFDLFQKSDDWCLEFLRFNKEQVCEMSYLLDIPESFPDGFIATATTALSLVCYRLAWPQRLKDCIFLFGHGKSWLSTVFNFTYTHINNRFRAMLRWNDNHLTPVAPLTTTSPIPLSTLLPTSCFLSLLDGRCGCLGWR